MSSYDKNTFNPRSMTLFIISLISCLNHNNQIDSNYDCEGTGNDAKILSNNTHYTLLLFMNTVIAICINNHKLNQL